MVKKIVYNGTDLHVQESVENLSKEDAKKYAMETLCISDGAKFIFVGDTMVVIVPKPEAIMSFYCKNPQTLLQVAEGLKESGAKVRIRPAEKLRGWGLMAKMDIVKEV